MEEPSTASIRDPEISAALDAAILALRAADTDLAKLQAIANGAASLEPFGDDEAIGHLSDVAIDLYDVKPDDVQLALSHGIAYALQQRSLRPNDPRANGRAHGDKKRDINDLDQSGEDALRQFSDSGRVFTLEEANAGANGKAEITVPTLAYVNVALDPVPPREWHVHDRIPRRRVSLVSGEGGGGKSTLMLQLGGATTLNRDWIGMLPEPGPVLYLSAEEDEAEICRRLEPIAAHYGVDRQELVARGLHAVSFLDPGRVKTLCLD